ncbi:hypothetical protein BCR35DRAFT_330574 [Leucosporidium creatinivorum]|uniref:Uncharacterized protein n=1 Tax=Leucosporidium creatinivorum TaxID=106004 RepID=A0A1Y2FRQ6_9BASI|nr:hypothetical protein BCR35DRAFT_330574 [Leucosporidium creatinivorum]
MVQLLVVVPISVICGSLILLLTIFLIVRRTREKRQREGKQVFSEERRQTEGEAEKGLLFEGDDPFASLPSSPRRLPHSSLPTLVISAPDDPPLHPFTASNEITQPNTSQQTSASHSVEAPILPAARPAAAPRPEDDHERLRTISASTTSTSASTSSTSTIKPSFFRRLFSPSSTPSLSAFPSPPSPSTSQRTLRGSEVKQRPSSEPLLSSGASWRSGSLFQEHLGREGGGRTRTSLSSTSSGHSFRSLGSLDSIPESSEEGGGHVDAGGMYYDRSRETDEEDELAQDPDWPLEESSYGVEDASISAIQQPPSPDPLPAHHEHQPTPLPLSTISTANSEQRLPSPTTPTNTSPGAAESPVDPLLSPRSSVSQG